MTTTHSTAPTLRRRAVRRRPLAGWRALSVGAVVGIVGLAACGGGDDAAESMPSEIATAASGHSAADIPADDVPADADTPADADRPADTAAMEADSAEAVESDGPLDVCALISSADVAAAFGAEFDQGTLTHHEQIGADQCIWNGLDPMAINLFSLSVQREADLPDEMIDNGIDVELLFDETKKGTSDAVDMALGDRAYASGSTVHVLFDDAMYDFMTVGDAPEDVAGVQNLAMATMEAVAS
jgi:hypothetical protein